MKITQVVPILDKQENALNEEEYDKYICVLYDDNFSLVNTFETHKQKLTDGQGFIYHNKLPLSDIKMSISYDYTKLTIEHNVTLFATS